MAATAGRSLELVPLTDAAPRLGGYRAAWLLVMDGRLGAERRGSRWFVSPERVEALLREATPPDPVVG